MHDLPEWLPLMDYDVRRSAPDGRQPRCRGCSREWYVRNRAEHVLRVRERNRRVRASTRSGSVRTCFEHPCVDCGEADLRVLDLDHDDPSKEVWNLSRLVTLSLPWATVLAGIDTCSVRCADCHRRRTSESFAWWRSTAGARRREALQAQTADRLSGLPPRP